MKKVLQTLFATVLVLVLAAGCGQQASNGGGDGDHAKKEQAKTEKPKVKQKKELTPEQIIVKSSNKMKDWPGMEYKMSGTSNILAQQGDQKKKVTQDLDMDAQIKLQPMEMHMTGNISMEGQNIPTETYYKGKTMYSKAPGQGWIAIQGMDLNALQENSQAQDPTEQMKQITKMMKDLHGSDGDKYIKKKEEDGSYVITLALDQQALSKVKGMAQKMVEQSMGSQMKQLMGDTMNNMQYKKMKITYYIDKKTFDQKKVDQQMTIQMKQSGIDMTIDSNTNMDIKGKYEGDITIPDDVKNNAQKVDMKQLEEAQKQQQNGNQ